MNNEFKMCVWTFACREEQFRIVWMDFQFVDGISMTRERLMRRNRRQERLVLYTIKLSYGSARDCTTSVLERGRERGKATNDEDMVHHIGLY